MCYNTLSSCCCMFSNRSPLFCRQVFYLCLLLICGWVQSCSISSRIGHQTKRLLLEDSTIQTGQTGIAVYDLTNNRYLYQFQSDRYFLPASNMKLFTTYAAMEYLGDSLPGLYYQNWFDTALNILPTGDPTFLHPDFAQQPVLIFLQNNKTPLHFNSKATNISPDNIPRWGKGWSWDDYNEYYMAECNAFPIYGNVVTINRNPTAALDDVQQPIPLQVAPAYFQSQLLRVVEAAVAKPVYRREDSSLVKMSKGFFRINRAMDENVFSLQVAAAPFKRQEIPFATEGMATACSILKTDFGFLGYPTWMQDHSLYGEIPPHLQWHRINSQPTDSVLQRMLFRSDNFYAEQLLLMVSQRILGEMNTDVVIDSLQNRDFKDAPQALQWVDGSGLSRYNLVTPQSLIYVLKKLTDRFGLERVKRLLPTAGQGSLKNYAIADSNFFFAKTGSMSNHFALSGVLITNSGRCLLFSFMHNHFKGPTTSIRKREEQFIAYLRKSL